MSDFAKRLVDYDNPSSLGVRLRSRRAELLLSLLESTHRSRGSVRILDLGGTEQYWRLIAPETLDALDVSITCVNLWAEQPSPGGASPRIHQIEGDACDLRSTFPDLSFDLVHSNSVIEHVGDWERMASMAREVRRLAPSYYVQTPNFWFPVEPHAVAPMFHWLPVPTRLWLVQRAGLGNWPRAASMDEAVHLIEGARLLNRKLFGTLFPDATLHIERFLGLPKSLVAVRTSGDAAVTPRR
jgi:methyltransferase family protein